MSSNRLTYDKCAYRAALQQSVGPVDYMLDPIKYEHCKKCRMELGIVGGTAVSHINGNMVDLESDLRGQTRTGTRCAQYKYIPSAGTMLQSKNPISCQPGPEIDTSLKHLESCQMVDYQEVPREPRGQPFSCHKH